MWNKQNIGFCISVVIILYFLLNSAGAQGNGDLMLVDCKLWDLEGDTIEGKLIYVHQFNFQFKLTLADTNGNTIKHYSPKDLTGFHFMIADRLVEYESMPNPFDIGRVFLKVIYRGDQVLYQFLDINYKSSGFSYLTFYYLWENKWLDPPISLQNEKNALLYHFSDCPELEYKIKTHEYNLSNIKQILEEYHSCQLTDDYEFIYE